jgi:hypothetical protein
MSAMWQKLGASRMRRIPRRMMCKLQEFPTELQNMVLHAQTSNSKTFKNPSLIPLKQKSLFFNPYGFRT